jgi:hypothetical protein
MRDPQPLDDETAAALEAIDATLHGEPVDPDFADFAELSLILRDERPQPAPGFLAVLDARAARRFTTPARAGTRSSARQTRRAWWGVGSALTGVAVLVVLLLTVHIGGVDRVSMGASSGVSTDSGSAAVATASAAPAATRGEQRASVPAPAPAPRSGRGRDVTQSAQLVLQARAGQIDGVAQQVFDVIGAERGTVQSSHVVDRARGAGSARFTLQVPSGRLQATLTRLSSLRGATVSSRSDASADITGDVNTTAGRLAAAHALRRSLLAQLAAADTATLAARLQTALRRNETQIVSDENALARLRGRVSDSTILVSVSASPVRPRRRRPSTGFTITHALHDAGRVLIVAAGAALIALAVLVPLGLLVALGSWVWALTLHRRRERTLGP